MQHTFPKDLLPLPGVMIRKNEGIDERRQPCHSSSEYSDSIRASCLVSKEIRKQVAWEYMLRVHRWVFMPVESVSTCNNDSMNGCQTALYSELLGVALRILSWKPVRSSKGRLERRITKIDF